VLKLFRTLGLEVSEMWGMSETGAATWNGVRDVRIGTVGCRMPGVEVRLADDGELLVRGGGVTPGYFRDPQATAEAIDADGWMHTGDLAAMDECGYLRITGRIKDIVIRGGENISPREIEECLYTHPDIVDGHVIGVPDARYGEELMAVVKLRDGAPELTIDGLREFCTGQIARFKIPRYLWIVDEFPMTVTGKIRKVEMRQRAIEYLDGQG